MTYREADLNYTKGLIFNINNVSRVKNGNIGDTLYGLDESFKAFLKKEKEKRKLLQLQKELLKKKEIVAKICQSMAMQSTYIDKSNQKIKKIIFYKND